MSGEEENIHIKQARDIKKATILPIRHKIHARTITRPLFSKKKVMALLNKTLKSHENKRSSNSE